MSSATPPLLVFGYHADVTTPERIALAEQQRLEAQQEGTEWEDDIRQVAQRWVAPNEYWRGQWKHVCWLFKRFIKRVPVRNKRHIKRMYQFGQCMTFSTWRNDGVRDWMDECCRAFINDGLDAELPPLYSFRQAFDSSESASDMSTSSSSDSDTE